MTASPHRANFHRAVAHHRSGRLRQAERVLTRMLAERPDDADALDLLGVIAAESGHADRACTLIAQAIRLGGPTATYCSHLGAILEHQQNLSGAIACYRQALDQQPDDAGLLWRLGNLLHRGGQLDEAAQLYERCTVLAPNNAEAWFNLGVTLTMLNRPAEGLRCYERTLALSPKHKDAHNNLGILLHASGRLDSAVASYRRALHCAPHYGEARYNLGLALQQQDRLDEAASTYRRLLADWPHHREAHNNLGNVLLAQNDVAGAIQSYQRALHFDPHHAEANWNMGLVRLLKGDLAAGWRGFEWRFEQVRSVRRHGEHPRWAGQDLKGGRVLLWAEQGLGDTLQFIRYAAMAEARGASVVVECHAPLVPLMKSVPGVGEVFAIGDELPLIEAQIPIMSLPHLFGTTLESIPAPIPYVGAAPEAIEEWEARLKQFEGPRIGLVWLGNPNHKNDHHRSIPLDTVRPLLELGAHWFTLQPDVVAPDGMISLAEHLHSFADTAAAITQMDLVISVDTSVAHLAGSMGCPVWALIPHAPDWRWMLDRPDSPWYPSMTLYRQPRRGDWDSVIAQVRHDLAEAASKNGHSLLFPGGLSAAVG